MRENVNFIKNKTINKYNDSSLNGVTKGLTYSGVKINSN